MKIKTKISETVTIEFTIDELIAITEACAYTEITYFTEKELKDIREFVYTCRAKDALWKI